jgi:hypothetical protein
VRERERRNEREKRKSGMWNLFSFSEFPFFKKFVSLAGPSEG